MVKYSPAGEIVNVLLSLVIGFIREAALPLQQEFQIAFVQVRANKHMFFKKIPYKTLKPIRLWTVSQHSTAQLSGSCVSVWLLNRMRWLFTTVEIQDMWSDVLFSLEPEQQNILTFLSGLDLKINLHLKNSCFCAAWMLVLNIGLHWDC